MSEPHRLVEPGETAPAFALPDAVGAVHALSDFQGRPVILYFYPRDSTPGCTKQACGFRDLLAESSQDREADGSAAVFGISPDNAKAHAKFAAKHALNFPLLVDSEQHTARAYGVWGEKKMYGKTFEGIARTTYLIDPVGRVAHRWDKVKVAGHIEEVAAALATLPR